MSDASSRHSPLRPEHQLKGPRPPPLGLSKESRKIRKQNVAPPPAAAEAKSHHHPPPPPVIIYTESPKVIHVDPNEFMSLVQRLTGSNSSSSSSSTLNTPPPPPPSYASGGGVSPAAQLAGVPEWRETQFFDGGGDEMPQNSLWNETDSNQLSYLNTGLHGNMNFNNFSENNMITNMPSSSVLDVFNYLRDI